MSKQKNRAAQKITSPLARSKNPERELTSSANFSHEAKLEVGGGSSLFKSCKMTGGKMLDPKQKLATIKQQTISCTKQSGVNKATSIMTPTLELDNFSLTDSITESMVIGSLKRSSNNLKESLPSHIAGYKHVLNVKSPSYIQNSVLISNLQDSKMIDHLINPDLKLRSTYESQHLKMEPNSIKNSKKP